ncbi:hypothetical protein NF673_09510 [Pseudomonas moraviensis]|uniref:hypothetical protein n=1 Tax=Pseudomonas moraviensis TaxID=321662 RepID=UPI002092C744|nr:hypothetical protein [Pseudomonas moraviensis]UST65967.1 hypothetical protein NF673_09510 [Pseudomonas moraviensis]
MFLNLEILIVDYRAASQMMVAALALMGSYSEAATHQSPPPRLEVECNHLELAEMRKELKELAEGWSALDGIFASALRACLKRDNIAHQEFSRVAELLNATRALESALKSAQPPVQLAADHLKFRRVVAGTRARLAELDSLYRQATRMPEYVDTEVNFNGLKELASFTNARLAHIA